MRPPSRSNRSLLVASCFSLPLALAASASGIAPEPAADVAAEPAVAWTADDPKLAWGPCPPFLPEGCALAVLHGDPAQPNVDALLRLPARSDAPLHWHTSPERMILVSGELEVSYEGQPSFVVRPGGYIYGPAKRHHSGRCLSDVPCVLFIAFVAPLDAVPVEGAAK